jgi:hypothetical protein
MYIMEDFGMEKAGIFSGHLDFLEVNFAFGRVCIYGPKVFNQHFSFGSVSTDTIGIQKYYFNVSLILPTQRDTKRTM